MNISPPNNSKIPNNPDLIWQAIATLQQQQKELLDALNKIYPNNDDEQPDWNN